MKRNILMFGCVICCLILVSLSYQSIIAEKSIIKPKEEIKIEEEDCEYNIIGKNLNYPEKLCEFLGRFHSNLYSFTIFLETWLILFPFRILGYFYYFIIFLYRSTSNLMHLLDCP